MAIASIQSSSSRRPSPSRVRWPGLPERALPAGTERYLVPGGGSVTTRIHAGDRLRVVNREGGQIAELLAFRDGRCDSGLLQGDGRVQPRSAITDELRGLLQRRGLSADRLSAIALFERAARAGDSAELVCSADGVLVVAAPGGPMSPHEQNPPTELLLFIERRDPAQSDPDHQLPEPLADPKQDFRIDRASAQSYLVKAGQWIQVIDVAGRQCSDFQAFPVAALEQGIERCLDATATRTLMGQGYPQPGQLAKCYDHDFNPLVEIVQDNCSRHDAFGLACTAKYYEDMGYPGHVNCSDNFSRELAQHQIGARRGWMALNFFFNTGVDDGNAFYFDEPWSRPGDYILMRAVEDIVCISSACPCDIDAANGWNPTDIHIRVYEPNLQAKRSIGFRKRTDAEVEMTKETGFHARTSALTRDFVEYNGYWLPNSYRDHGAIAEYWACRERAIVMDLSALRKFEITGPDAENLMNHCLTRNIRKLAVGQVVYTAMCYDTGTMLDDGTLYRLGADNFRWIGGCDSGGDWLRKKAADLGLEVWVRSSTDQLHNLAVQGPASRDILREIIWTPPTQTSIDELGWFRLTIGRIGGEHGIAVVVSRTGYSGELGYEIFCHPRDGAAVWDAVWEAGRPHDMVPLGLEALDTLRIEAGLIFAGYEFDDQTDPFEAGIGFTVPLKSKNEDFCGREALLKRKENPQRKLVGLELAGGELAAHGDCVRVGKHQVGVITSGTKSPILGKNVALCRMAIEYSQAGTEVEVGKLDGEQKRLPAVVVPLSFYDPKKTRPQS